MSRFLLPLLISGALICCTPMHRAAASSPVTSTAYSVSAISGPVGFMVTKIDFRSDLTRIYGRLIGRPHTSGRIDALSLTLPDGETVAATDIDGIDMKRYFQWEDDNYIEVEIDFPPVGKSRTMTIDVCGPNGNCRWTIVRK